MSFQHTELAGVSWNNDATMINMKFFRVFLALLGGTHVLCAQPSASPTVKSTGGSSLASVVAGSKPLNKPDFDDIAPRNVTAIVGQTAELNCFVKHPGDRVVSWIRKRDLHILTSSIYAYTGDERFSVKHPETSDEWTLKIDYVQQRDAGVYECQVNTEPKLNLAFVLRVEESAPVPATTTPNAIHRTFNSAAQAKILGPEEVYVKKGSTISLTCTVNVQSTPPSSVSWHHGGAVVDFDSPRGGVSLETEKTESGTTSRLLVTQARLTDSGNYTCIPSNANPASVMVHVLNGEHPAAMQHGGSCGVTPTILLATFTLVISNLLR
ncbi:basement membrane-specific heparan sulfate proteoglycan core protein-like isoform X2 [Bombus affinis]|uniref:Basement membrane-specific heparan sulfate proteoglycan core protein isoform X2 n=1 Tax=Bombus terrestris TaxID=30195 RepID=A0A9C6W0H4_BOMTE|nr:basement membrane-specific heparan sulfate proteoglycan core protein isoform X2 [Bombus terrestris]XP_050591317.1 basement membrane-specific heparan sulfate proteoglycan core protein-like isoform X2 [Bombus affinis]